MIQARLHSSRLASPRGYDHMSKTQFPIELMLNINLTKAFQYVWKDLVMMCNLSKKKIRFSEVQVFKHALLEA